MTRVLMALAVALVPAFVLAQPPAAAPAAADRLTLDLYWDYETVADPQISPDGSQIIYTRQWFDRMNDSRESSLWIMNADGSKNRFLVRGSNARWSPSGDRILYSAQ
ncbi:MAG: TolB family protein, partial [Vicinamibacteria bacterium]